MALRAVQTVVPRVVALTRPRVAGGAAGQVRTMAGGVEFASSKVKKDHFVEVRGGWDLLRCGAATAALASVVAL